MVYEWFTEKLSLFKIETTFLFLIDISNYSSDPTWRNTSPARLTIILFGHFPWSLYYRKKFSRVSTNICGLWSIFQGLVSPT